MNLDFAPYRLRRFRPKSAKVADNGFTATLVRGDIAVATVDCGTGPDNDDLTVEFVNRSEQEFFLNVANRRPASTPDMSADECFVRDLAEATYHAGRLAELMRNNTVFRLRNDPPGHWRHVRAPYRPALERAIRRRFPAGALEFAPSQGIASH